MMFEPAFLNSTVAIRLMTGHIMQMIIAEIASVITIGLSWCDYAKSKCMSKLVYDKEFQ